MARASTGKAKSFFKAAPSGAFDQYLQDIQKLPLIKDPAEERRLGVGEEAIVRRVQVDGRPLAFGRIKSRQFRLIICVTIRAAPFLGVSRDRHDQQRLQRPLSGPRSARVREGGCLR